MSVDEGIQLMSALTEGAGPVFIGLVAGDISGGEGGNNREAADGINGTEQGADAGNSAAVILDTFQTAVDGHSGGGGCQQKQHMLVADGGTQVIAEDHLIVGVEFRSDHVHCFVAVGGNEVMLFQLGGHESTYDLAAVHADDGINNCGIEDF